MKKSKWLLGILGLVSTLALAASTLTATWTLPTTNTDTTTIPATGAGSLTSSTVQYGPCNSTGTALASVTGTTTVGAGGVSSVISGLGPGNWCAQVQVTNTYGNISAWSNVASKVIPGPTPSAPTNFSLN